MTLEMLGVYFSSIIKKKYRELIKLYIYLVI